MQAGADWAAVLARSLLYLPAYASLRTRKEMATQAPIASANTSRMVKSIRLPLTVAELTGMCRVCAAITALMTAVPSEPANCCIIENKEF